MVDIDKIFKYLESKIPTFQKINRKGKSLFSCPKVDSHKFNKDPSVTLIVGSEKFYCLSCGWKGSLNDLIRIVEKKPNLTDKEMMDLITNEMKADFYPELDEYVKYGWSLISVAKNGKIPLEKGWTEKEHKEKSEWLKWIESGFNIGIRTGEVSGITVIDADLKVAPSGEFEKIYKELTSAKTLTQNTPHGKQFIFKYNKDLKQTSKIAGITIDIRNDGGQVVCPPSKINNLPYNWINLGNEIKEIPESLKDKLLINKKRDDVIIETNLKNFEISGENEVILKNNDLSGCRNDSLISFSGILLKNGLLPKDIKIVLNVLNTQLLAQPRHFGEIETIMGSIKGYKQTEEQTQYNQVLECCKLLQIDITANEVEKHTELKKNIVNKLLSQFHKEGKLTRKRQGRYDLKEQVEWTNETQPMCQELAFEIPYFNDIAHFRDGDMIILGAFSGKGKTTIAVNIIKQLRAQGITPYYISLESGSRHEIISEKLGLTQFDYYIPKNPVMNPTQVELVEKAITIIDWVNLGEDFAATPDIFKHLSDEMRIKKGFLIVMTQTRKEGKWFAPDLINQFARFSAIFQIMDEQGINGVFNIDKITEPKGQYLQSTVQTEYNFENKELRKKE